MLGVNRTAVAMTAATLRIKDSWKTFALLLFITFVFAATAFRYEFAVPGLFLPLCFVRREDRKYILAVGLILIIKIGSSLLAKPSLDYIGYPMDYFWIGREVTSVFLFYAWIFMGQTVMPLQRILTLGWKTLVLLLLTLYGCLTIFSSLSLVGGIDNLEALILLFYYILILGSTPRLVRFAAMVGLVLTALWPANSDFTIIACVALLSIYSFGYFNIANKSVPWRMAILIGIGILLVMSLFAYLVHFRPTRTDGEGNNGYTRATLAVAGYNELAKEPVLGSQLGRGILPLGTIEQLGWSQYFSNTGEYNAYALSYHDSFIYLLTRFGFLAPFLFVLFLQRIPRYGPLHVVAFSLIMILAAGANVVIESLRSGPGVGFVLGMLFGFAPIKRSHKARSYIRDIKAILPVKPADVTAYQR